MLQSTIFFWLAIAISTIFVFQFLLSLLGADSDHSVELDSPGGFAHDAFSFKGAIHFILGFSWFMYLIDVYTLASYGMGIGVGLVFVFVLFFFYKGVYSLRNEIPKESGQDLVGRIATIYSALENGDYLVTVEINGAGKQIQVTPDPGIVEKLKTGSMVQIGSYMGGVYYIIDSMWGVNAKNEIKEQN